MSDNKKYYYLKLKDNFFDSDNMILLESMQDGYLYSNILLKMYLRSLKDEGRLMLNNKIPYSTQMLATVTRQQIGTVEKAIKIFLELGLIETLDNGAIYISDIQNFIGHSSSEADRQRDYYNRIKSEKNNLLPEPASKKSSKESYKKPSKESYKESYKESNKKSTPEIEIEIEKEKDIELDIEIEINKSDELTDEFKNKTSHLNNIKDLLSQKKNDINKELIQKIIDYTNNHELQQTLINYLLHRKDIKKPIKTLNTLNLIFKELEKHRNVEIEVINQSILNGWIGLFALKNNNNNNQTSTNIFDEIGKERGLW